MKRRAFVCAAGAAVGFGAARIAWGQSDYPARVIRIVVPYPAGSGPDMLGRLVAQQLQKIFGRSVVVENRAGALGVVGTMEVARAAADGYSLALATNTTHAANVALYKDAGYHPLRDFAPVVRLCTGPMMLLVRSESPYADVAALQADANRSFSVGYGSAASQVAAAKLARGASLNVVNAAYKGIPAAVTDMLGGHIDYTFADLPVAVPLIQSGRARALAVTADRRLAELPDIPTLGESVRDADVMGWQGIVAPSGTPPAVLAKLEDAFRKAFQDSDFVGQVKAMHQTVAPLYGSDFETFITREIERWKQDAQLAGIEPQ
ncbi:tripartite tricarboxylate transporter substrate binding protein [Verticiella sediminum]|uniref:Tripartite tricarboxylate transporter substrate binding protein n=1 Tax=Verticiella sediminum TaxID=1247510 RepID=A0A556A819_9BURK|nr:tripartite tricarboxylate transporter substrate binding protein [Verticiella sediminum]TSH89038.1 tripartite tricarboxylate transporter substrate binding protein [Verticiella sediminum]